MVSAQCRRNEAIKGCAGHVSTHPPSLHHTHMQWAPKGEIYFAMAPTVTQKHKLIFILRVIYVYQGPQLGDGSMCEVSTEIPFGARCSPRTRDCFSYSVNRRKKCVTVLNSSSFSGATSQTSRGRWIEIKGFKCSCNELILFSWCVFLLPFMRSLD